MTTPKHKRLIGKVIADRYHIVDLIGEGGMGAVYLAEHLTLHKQVALKVVHAEHANNPELAARFSREAMATSLIEHPNVISAIDYGTLPDGTAYLAVQLVRGPTLTRVLSTEGPMAWTRAAALGVQIADALCAAHGHGIVHRDLKPDNVLLQYLDDGGEQVKVLDFGVAKFKGNAGPGPDVAGKDVTRIGFIVGTPGYMAPEQALGQPADVRSDLYSLGVVLWESMVGRTLWTAPDLQRLVERQLVETPARLLTACADTTIPPELDELVAKLLSRRTADRPPDAITVRDTLREIVKLAEGEPQRWRTGARPVPASLRPAAEQAAKAVARESPKPQSPAGRVLSSARPLLVRTSKTAWVFAGVLSAILLAAAFLVGTGRVELRPRRDVVQAAQRVAEKLNLPAPSADTLAQAAPTDEEPDPPGPSGLPRALEATYEKLLQASDRDARNDAADLLLAHLPAEEVPQYVRRVAGLQLARSCREKRGELFQLAELKDARALPALVRLAQKPRSGCGRKHREDCYACLRDPLEELIAKLEGGSARAPQ